MEEEGDWVMLRRPAESELWNPTEGMVMNGSDVGDGETSRPLKIAFKEPAKHWTDALPIGNGSLGAMVWGGVDSEILNLNEDTLWTGVPANYTDANVPKSLTPIRQLVDEGKYDEATTLADTKLSGNPSDVYQLIGDLKLEFDTSDVAYIEETYWRELDLDTATVTVRYSIGNVEFTRQHFVSNPDKVMVIKISATKPGSISFTASFDSKLHHHSYVNGKEQIVMEGSCPGKRIPPRTNINQNNPEGIHYTTALQVQIGGSKGVIQNVDNKKLSVKDCDSVIILLVASSSFENPFTDPSDSKKDPTSECITKLNSIKRFSYSDLYTRHLDDYQQLFHRVSLQLSKSIKSATKQDPINVPTAERVKSFKTDEDPSFIELLFQYGRYLLISCSRPGTQPANLQGIWNYKIEPAWDCAPHLNINLQMNYWPSLPCNLKECQEPLFDYISSLSVTGTKTAKVNYEANGWVVHQVSDIWAKTSPDRGLAVWALWPMGGAWVCTHLWEHYTYTMDKKFLEDKAYPLMEGCTSFLLDWLIEGRGGVYLETNPSTSPEHTFIAPNGKPASVSYSSTMDISIIKEVFNSIVSAAEIMGKTSDDLIQRVVKAQTRLPPFKVSRDGSLMEWAEDFQDPEPHHRHVSHLFGVYPGHIITPEKTPDLCKAVDNTLFKRGVEGPGWSTTWKAALWARLHDSEHAYEMVKHLIDLVDPDKESLYEGGLYSNLFTAHPPFQIDANFGFCAAISEMLVQSTMKDLFLLPALPRGKWANGCVKGMKARGGVTVNICWKEGDLHEVGLWCVDGNVNCVKSLHYRGSSVEVKVLPGKVYSFNNKLTCVRTLSLPGGAI
ncbi:hypothetical protein V2J09_018389 [Rumex salicifolius]